LATSPSVDESAAPSRAQVAGVLIGCGTIGLFAGAVWHPVWQDAVEPAQVLAGFVSYPPDNPVYLYSTRVWTVVHQLSAALLTAGWSERAISLLLSGLMGIVAFQALGLVVLALSRDVLLATVSPFFIVLTNTASGGVTYPIELLGVSWTYGIVGLSYALLAMALAGVGRVRGAALLLGFGPALHVTIGFWAIAVTAVAAAFDRHLRGSIAAAAPWFLAGAAAALASAAFHALYQPGTGATAPLSSLSAWGAHWDEHRQPFPLLGSKALAASFAAAVPALWLSRFAADVPAHARALVRCLVVSAALGALLSISYWLVPPDAPSVVAALMPSRMLNLSGMACMALLIGLSPQYSANRTVRVALVAMVIGLIGVAAVIPLEDGGTTQKRVGWSAMAVYAAILAIAAERCTRTGTSGDLIAWLRGRVRVVTIVAIAVALTVVVIVNAREFGHKVAIRFVNHMSDDLLAAAARRPGLLLTSSSLHLLQLTTGRPVLLDGGALDALLYVPEAAGASDRILRRVYGTSLERVQQERRGYLHHDAGRTLWESRTSDEWRAIGDEFGVTDVLTYADWDLRLPVIASNAELVLYAIPD
jgi:hypothetical protein